jgi:hypothetical protein
VSAACGPALRGVLVVGCALALTLVFVPAAAAANPVPNPGFEAACGPIDSPCSWSGGDRDLDNPHSGSASLRTFLNELTVIERAFSACVATSVPPGPMTFSFWYRTGDTRINGVAGSVTFFSDTGCSSSSGHGSIDQPATTDDAWHPASTVVTVPVNVQSIQFALGAAGGVGPGDPPAPVNFDDLSLGSPTAAARVTFGAVRRQDGVHLSWRSAMEVGVLGYRVLRVGPGGRTVVIRGLVRAAGGGGPASYRVVDRTACSASSFTYSLQAVRTDGSRQTVRSVRVAG